MDLELTPGTEVLGKLRIERELGRGGLGAVYVVTHTLTHHRRAMKLLHPQFRADRTVVERFLREASAAGRIGNPHIVETFDAGTLESGAPFLLMELLEGQSLAELLRGSGRLSADQTCQLMVQVCDALGAAHAAGIVHRDIKPENLFITQRDGLPFVKVLDFGISKFDTALTGAAPVTTDNSAMGTPLYMAPEQLRGERSLDRRADLYAVGVVAYECLAGGTPYDATSFAELAVKVLSGKPPPLLQLRPELPPGLCEVVHRAFAVEPADRFPDAEALSAALSRFVQSQTVPHAPRRSVDELGLEATAVSGRQPIAAAATPALGEGLQPAPVSEVVLLDRPRKKPRSPLWYVATGVLATGLGAAVVMAVQRPQEPANLERPASPPDAQPVKPSEPTPAPPQASTPPDEPPQQVGSAEPIDAGNAPGPKRSTRGKKKPETEPNGLVESIDEGT